MNDNCYIQSFHLIEVQKAQYFAIMWFFEEHDILLKIDMWQINIWKEITIIIKNKFKKNLKKK